MRSSGGITEARNEDGSWQSSGEVDSFQLLASLTEWPEQVTVWPDPENEPPFWGGLLGLVGYEAGRFVERKLELPYHLDEPEFYFLSAEKLILVDHQLEQSYLVLWSDQSKLPLTEALADNLIRSFAEQLLAPAPALAQEAPELSPLFEERFSRAEFVRLVEAAKEYIAAGEAYQIVLSNTLAATCEVDPLRAYDRLVRNNASPFHYLVEFGEAQTFVGASPETMLCGGPDKENGKQVKVAIRPVKGTYRRSEDAQEDRLLVQQLLGDSKELAEHLMLVDHERNDLGRVARVGSVQVHGLFSVESYQHLHHLISQVSAVLSPTENVVSALRACFPIGTLCGTPKVRAMELVCELEGEARGIFGGAIVTLSHRGQIDSCVAIRGASISPSGVVVKAGAGIVFDSLPDKEYEECRLKARSMLESLFGVSLIQAVSRQ